MIEFIHQVPIDLSSSKLSKAAKKCIQTVLSYDNVCCQFLRRGDGWVEQLPLPDEALLAEVTVPKDLAMGKFILTHAKPIGEGTSGTVLRGWMAGRVVALKLQYEKCPGLNHGMCRNAYSRIWSHIPADAGLSDWFGFCIGRVPYSRETVYISLMSFHDHLLDNVPPPTSQPKSTFVLRFFRSWRAPTPACQSQAAAAARIWLQLLGCQCCLLWTAFTGRTKRTRT